MTSLPQVLVNVRIDERRPRPRSTLWPTTSRPAEGRLGDRRAGCWCGLSGTEPLIRVMVEAPSEAEAETEAATLADAVHRIAG